MIEPGGISFVGPTTRRSERVLTGSGWAVGALLRPAAAPVLAENLASLRDSTAPIEAPTLHRDVFDAMGDLRLSPLQRRERATIAFAQWLQSRLPTFAPSDEAAVANRLEGLLADPRITRVDQLPELLHLSVRSLQRLAERHFGLSLHSMIRRRRLQEGAERLREHPEQSIAALANDLGYADHAHFARDFKQLLGMSPSEYRAAQ